MSKNHLCEDGKVRCSYCGKILEPVKTEKEGTDVFTFLDCDCQKAIREEIRKRWESIGLTDGLSGELKENIRQLFESDAKQLSYDEIEWPKIRTFNPPKDGISKEET